MENLDNRQEGEPESQSKWPIVSLRMSRELLDSVMQITGESSYGKAVKAAVLEFLRTKGAAPALSPRAETVSRPSAPVPATIAPATEDKDAKIAEALTALAQSIQTLKAQPPAPPPPQPTSPRQDYRQPQVVPTPEQEALRNSAKLTEQDYRMFFKRMRSVGQRDATAENEDAFWQYLIAADFCKGDGMPITKFTLPTSWIAWLGRRHKEDREFELKAKAEEAEKAAAAERAEADRVAYEKWNDMMLRSEENTNWDDE